MNDKDARGAVNGFKGQIGHQELSRNPRRVASAATWLGPMIRGVVFFLCLMGAEALSDIQPPPQQPGESVEVEPQAQIPPPDIESTPAADSNGVVTNVGGDADLLPGDADLSLNDYAELSLEELMSIEVTSVSGLAQEWFRSPAAVYVLTHGDIRRSGHKSIPELLRLVPGVSVARLDDSRWAVSTRGFGSLFSNKLLVLIDGRVVYDPMFSGTLWDVQDVVTEDLDRIEVIRGPGATLWGANAVNGVINVTTKSAKDTQGFYLNLGAGDEEQGFGTVRYGGKINDATYFRVWMKYANHDNFTTPSGGDSPDDWDMTQGGLRTDIEGPEKIDLTLQAGLYDSNQVGESFSRATRGHLTYATVVGDGRISGENFLARLKHDDPAGHGWSVQAYYDQTSRVAGNNVVVRRDTFDLDGRHYFKLGHWNDVIWGLGYRFTRDRTDPTTVLLFLPISRGIDTMMGFVQDTVTIVPDRLSVMVGSKFEYNDYTGFEYQPSGRLSWTPNTNNTVWAAVSRPVRTPSRVEDDLQFVSAFVDTGLAAGGPPSRVFVPIMTLGNDAIESEEVTAYEMGYRVRVTEDLSLDLATYYNEYENLVVLVSQGPTTNQFQNAGAGESYGGELALSCNVTPNWHFTASYSYLDIYLRGGLPGSSDFHSPRHMAGVASYWDITPDLELNSALYYVDSLSGLGIDSYIRLDLGMTWRPIANLELSAWGQNLLDPSHPESRHDVFVATPTEIERSLFFEVTLRY